MNKKQPELTEQEIRITENLGEAVRFMAVFGGREGMAEAWADMPGWLAAHWSGLRDEDQFYLVCVAGIPARTTYRIHPYWKQCNEAARLLIAEKVRGVMSWAVQILDKAPELLREAAGNVEGRAAA